MSRDKSSFSFDILAVDRASGVPMHRQLYEALRSYVLQGRLGAETRLPPTRFLAQQLGVGRNTVIAAYDQLLAEGYIEARPGSGTWITALNRPIAKIRVANDVSRNFDLSARGRRIASHPPPQRTRDKINLHPGFPDAADFPFATWSRLLTRNARRPSADLLTYYDFAGDRRLREAIADYLGVARGVDCVAEQVIVVSGAQAALDLIARILMDEGDIAWMEEPGYRGARSALLGGGARLLPLRVSRQGWSLNDPDLRPARLIYVTPSCQWPLGTIMRMEERLQLLAIAERRNAFIIEDDYDGEYRFRGRSVPALRGLDRAERVIYVGTFGKTMFSSLRLGFLVVPRTLAEPFARAISVTGQFAPLLLQATLADFIREGYFAAHLKRMRRLYARRQEQFIELCHQRLAQWMTVTENDSGMQVLGRFVFPFDDRAVAAAALARGIDVQPVSINYGHDEPEHGLLLGYAGLNGEQMMQAVTALRATFQDLARTPARREHRA